MIGSLGKECSLCGACAEVCPVGCISLSSGANRAVIDTDRCLDCHQCEKHCHLLGEVPFKAIRSAYAAAAAQGEYRTNGASGGAFAALAETCLRRGGVVFGCAWRDGSWEAAHIKIEDIKALPVLQGSKYVHSATGRAYAQAREALQQGKLVLYAGRPCQIAGLYRFLGRSYDNLTTVDLVCHGVPDAKLFQEYIAYYEERHGCRVVSWRFRAHSKGRSGYFGEVTLKKRGRRKTKPLLWNCDSYYASFMHAASYREVCYTCRYAQRSRVGDITLGDFWGIERVFPDEVAGSISLVLANSEAGERMIRECGWSRLDAVDVETACAHNGQLNAPTGKPKSADQFWALYRQGGWKAVDDAFCKRTKKNRLIAWAVFYFPQGLKRFLRKLRRR